nr:helix-turn-helix domain-containing protein [uncultured Draconibacterium sp.]
MRYFKSEKAIRRFIQQELLSNNRTTKESYKDESSFWIQSKYTYYLKNSQKGYNSVDEIIEELKRNNLLFEVQQMSDGLGYKFDFVGYILLYSQLQILLSGDESLNNDILRFKLLTINQTCDFLQLSRPSIYKLLKDGVIPHVEIMGQKRVQMNDLLHFIMKSKSQKE